MLPEPRRRSVPGSGTAFVASSVSDRARTVRVKGAVPGAPGMVVVKINCATPDSVMSAKHATDPCGGGSQAGTEPPVSSSELNETRKGAVEEVDGPNWK